MTITLASSAPRRFALLLGLLPACTGGENAASGGGGAPATCTAAEMPFGTTPGTSSFPDLPLADCAGERSTVADLRCGGQVTFISFGAGWCEPCRAEAPALQQAGVELADEGVVVAQVMFQDADARPATTQFCQLWRDELDLTIPVFIDPVENSTEFFDVAGTPLNVIVDRDGRVLWSKSGRVDDVTAAITPYL